MSVEELVEDLLRRRAGEDRLLDLLETLLEPVEDGEDLVHHPVDEGVEDPVHLALHREVLLEDELADLAAGRDGAPVDGDEEAGAEVGGELVAVELEPFLRRPQPPEEEEEVPPELLHLRRLDGGQGVLDGEGVEAADVGQLAGLLVGRVLDVDPDGASGEAGPGGGESRVLEKAEPLLFLVEMDGQHREEV